MIDRFVLSVGREEREGKCPNWDKKELDVAEEFNIQQEQDLL